MRWLWASFPQDEEPVLGEGGQERRQAIAEQIEPGDNRGRVAEPGGERGCGVPRNDVGAAAFDDREVGRQEPLDVGPREELAVLMDRMPQPGVGSAVRGVRSTCSGYAVGRRAACRRTFIPSKSLPSQISQISPGGRRRSLIRTRLSRRRPAAADPARVFATRECHCLKHGIRFGSAGLDLSGRFSVVCIPGRARFRELVRPHRPAQ